MTASAPQLAETTSPALTVTAGTPSRVVWLSTPVGATEIARKTDQGKAAKAKGVTQGNVPAAGATYLQLSATSKHDADALFSARG